MPRPTLPPTPSSSSDIKGRDGSRQLGSLQLAFELPPPAMTSNEATTPQPESKLTPTNSPFVQASESVKSRRRSSSARETKEAFTLPPPPTRSRKIIQMKPKPQEDAEPANSKSSGAGKGSAAGSIASGGSKKKQPSATSAAGRKIARKTAHSLIERRRRSKMNEEFAVLKNMIPACKGEMHKLAILQASIDYVRYLEECVSKLKAQRSDGVMEDQSGQQTPFVHDQRMSEQLDSDRPGSVEMVGSAIPSPTYPGLSQSHQSSISPVLHAEDTRHRQDSYSSVSTDQRHYSYSGSATTSPAFGPQTYGYSRGTGSTLPSPALLPQRDLDQEATAALLMLNSDRRGLNGGLEGGAPPAPGRGMSVRDLLST